MENDQAAVLAAFNDFFQNIRSSQALRNLDLYDRSGECRLIGSDKGEETYGYSSLQSFFQCLDARPASFDFRWQDVHCTVEGSAAWVFARGQVTGGGLAMPRDYLLTCNLVRRSGSWLMSHFHGSEPR